MLLIITYPNQDSSATRFNGKKYCLPEGIIKNCNVIANVNNFYDQPIDSDIKRYEKF